MKPYFKKGKKFNLQFKIVEVDKNEGEKYYHIECIGLNDLAGNSIGAFVNFEDLEDIVNSVKYEFEEYDDEISSGVFVRKKRKIR